jgi:hypothetical protein
LWVTALAVLYHDMRHTVYQDIRYSWAHDFSSPVGSALPLAALFLCVVIPSRITRERDARRGISLRFLAAPISQHRFLGGLRFPTKRFVGHGFSRDKSNRRGSALPLAAQFPRAFWFALIS